MIPLFEKYHLMGIFYSGKNSQIAPELKILDE
jgi:hypothetical protein